MHTKACRNISEGTDQLVFTNNFRDFFCVPKIEQYHNTLVKYIFGLSSIFTSHTSIILFVPQLEHFYRYIVNTPTCHSAKSSVTTLRASLTKEVFYTLFSRVVTVDSLVFLITTSNIKYIS